jgi:hypothetical protein
MPRVVIKKADLPPINAEDDDYVLRFRLVSQDRNRTSFWTPLYQIYVQPVATISYDIHKMNAVNGKVVNVFWDDSASIEYDVYVKWYMTSSDPNAVWEYKGTTRATTFNLIDPDAHSYQVAVQVSTYPKERFNNYTLFESPKANL